MRGMMNKKLQETKERDKFIIEAMGLVYHDWKYTNWGSWYCATCDIERADDSYEQVYHQNYDFSTWHGFGNLKKLMCDYRDCELFFDMYLDTIADRAEGVTETFRRIQPDDFANKVYEFLKEREDGEL
jgi:hypothetical protein